MNENSIFSKILGRDANEDESRTDSVEASEMRRSKKRNESELGEHPWNSAVKLVVETIDDLPSNFPRESAVRIVKRTLAAAGIEIGDFNKRTWARMPQIRDEMELARSREREFRKKTEEDIHALEVKIRKAREAYETIRAEEEEEIHRTSKELENIKRVRAFLGFSDMDSDPEGDKSTGASGEVTEERGPLYTAGAQQKGRASFSSHSFSGSTRSEAKKHACPRGEQAPVRDSLDAAWGQIEALRAQMGQRTDLDAGADKPHHELRHPAKVEDPPS
jgi:hypothetical protein